MENKKDHKEECCSSKKEKDHECCGGHGHKHAHTQCHCGSSAGILKFILSVVILVSIVVISYSLGAQKADSDNYGFRGQNTCPYLDANIK